MPVEWKTSVSSEGEETLIRGYSVFELAQKRPFSDTVFLLLRGELPGKEESQLFNAILTMTATHGIGNLSTVGARVAASGGSPVNACIAAGLLALGPHHGAGPAEAAAANFQKNVSRNAEQLVTEFKNAGKRMPGYGHPVLKKDPRAQVLVELAEKLGLAGKHIKLALAVEPLLEKSAGRPLCFNLDGAYAALLSDLGFTPEQVGAVFAIGRSAGLAAHAIEEKTSEKPVSKRVPIAESRYTGPEKRSVPD